MTLIRKHFERILEEYPKYAPIPEAQQVEFREYIRGFFIGGIYMLIKTWLQDDLKHSPETMATLTYDLVMLGVLGSSNTLRSE